MTAKANGYFAPPRDWAALQRAYENHVGPLEPLAAANKIAEKTLRNYASGKKWIRLFPEKGMAPADQEPAADIPVASNPLVPGGLPAPTVRALGKRLVAAVALKLHKMETDMSASEPLSPIDHERHTRALGTMAKSLEKLNDIGREQQSGGRSGTPRPAAAPEVAANDEDKLRRELAARIKRLREQLGR